MVGVGEAADRWVGAGSGGTDIAKLSEGPRLCLEGNGEPRKR